MKKNYYNPASFYGQFHTAEWEERNKRMIERDGGYCRMCGKRKGLSAHPFHIIKGDVARTPDRCFMTMCNDCYNDVMWQKEELKDLFSRLRTLYHPLELLVIFRALERISPKINELPEQILLELYDDKTYGLPRNVVENIGEWKKEMKSRTVYDI